MTSWSTSCPDDVLAALQLAHPSWKSVIDAGLQQVHDADPDYLPGLKNSRYLPDQARLFAAFAVPMSSVRYILIGEGPYPRAESATGYCFMDGAVNGLWSDEEGGGLSKKVNRATSLRNFVKMLLVASGDLQIGAVSGAAVAVVARQARLPDATFIQTLNELQDNLIRQGFLLLNASLVFRENIAPVRDARAWQPFLQTILSELSRFQLMEGMLSPSLVLWGKIAEQLCLMPETIPYKKICAEHPYNLSFIANTGMQDFFRPMELLKKVPKGKML